MNQPEPATWEGRLALYERTGLAAGRDEVNRIIHDAFFVGNGNPAGGLSTTGISRSICTRDCQESRLALCMIRNYGGRRAACLTTRVPTAHLSLNQDFLRPRLLLPAAPGLLQQINPIRQIPPRETPNEPNNRYTTSVLVFDVRDSPNGDPAGSLPRLDARPAWQ